MYLTGSVGAVSEISPLVLLLAVGTYPTVTRSWPPLLVMRSTCGVYCATALVTGTR